MLIYFIRLQNNFKSGWFFCLLLLLLWHPVSAQEAPVWNKSLLKDSVISLLTRYQDFHNKLDNMAGLKEERDFVNLFSNSRIQVINDLESQPGQVVVSVEEYVLKLNELFPDGLDVHFDLSRMTMEQPRYDRNYRYLIKVRINRSLKGSSAGQPFSKNQRVLLLITFRYTGNTPENFTFYGMSMPVKGQSYLTATVAPALNGFVNTALKNDVRLGMNRGTSLEGELLYHWFYSGHIGFGTGARYARYSGSVSLAGFDALGGFDPNMQNVQIQNDLWFVEVPLFISYRIKASKRLEFNADLGFSAGVRLFENMESSAVNSNTGISMENVITDIGWIGQMNRYTFGIQAAAALNYRIGSRAGVAFGVGVRQGLSDLDKNTQPDYFGSKYLGQFNPLWGAPGKTSAQAFVLNLGIFYRLNKEEGR